MNASTLRDNDEIRLGDYFSGVWRYRIPLAAATAVAMGLALAVSMSAPRQYEATLTMMVSTSKFGEQASPSASLSPASFRPMLESRSIAATVIRELGLGKPPYNLTASKFLAGVISTEEVRGTSLLRLTATFSDSALAARIAQRVAELGMSVAQKVSADEAVQARDIIKEQVDAARKRYDQADHTVRAFRDTAQIEALKKDVEATLGLRGGLLDLLVEIESERARLARIDQELSKRTRVDTLRKTVDDSPVLSEAGRRGQPSGADGRATGLQLQAESVSEVYEKLDGDAASARANLAALEKQKNQLVDVRKIDSSKLPKLSLLYQREGELARLEVERDLAQKSYVGVATIYETARLQVASRSARLEIIDPAVTPDQPLPRHSLRNAALAGLGVLSVGVIVAMLAHALRRRPETRE